MSTPFRRVVVSASDAVKTPYPFVYVNSDGSVRELHAKEKTYLETPFEPFDGGRPYVKHKYDGKNGWGDTKGYCARSAIPTNLTVIAAPADDPG
jgi:hypothetical protein